MNEVNSAYGKTTLSNLGEGGFITMCARIIQLVCMFSVIFA